jgi:hypothetical protein
MECHCGSSPVGMPKLLQLHAVIPRFQGSLSWQRACRLRMPSVGFENRTKAGVLTLVDSQSLMTVPVSSWARSGSRSRRTSSAGHSNQQDPHKKSMCAPFGLEAIAVCPENPPTSPWTRSSLGNERIVQSDASFVKEPV